jgi:hypothetical protein
MDGHQDASNMSWLSWCEQNENQSMHMNPVKMNRIVHAIYL